MSDNIVLTLKYSDGIAESIPYKTVQEAVQVFFVALHWKGLSVVIEAIIWDKKHDYLKFNCDGIKTERPRHNAMNLLDN